MLGELISKFRRKDSKPATPHNPWDSASILRNIVEMNALGRDNMEIPSPDNLKKLRQDDPETTRVDVAHRTYMHEEIQTGGKLDGLSESAIRQRLVLWDLLNGFNEE